MDHREKTYKHFKAEFERGLLKIAEVDKMNLPPQERDLEVDAVSSVAIALLGRTEYGQKLMGDKDLIGISLNLNDGLVGIANELRKAPHSVSLQSAILWAEKCKHERQFKFLGEIGRIFNYFRDDPGYLDSKLEKRARESLRSAALECIEQADSLLSHVTVELTYEDEVVSEIRRLSETAAQLRLKLARPPVDWRDGANPFHDGGETIVVRQFSQAVSLLGFKLYGWMNHKVLTKLLEMKASTAEDYGLPLWLLNASGDPVDRERKLRGFISDALADARKRSKHPKYQTREMIQFYGRNRKRFTQDDGLAGSSDGDR